ncbi:hypothetical protein GCM10010218_65570 [Streptomyces mashuensis]|uniref:Uncharacterized protein n=1 Tax=Streptomyces mashuensis TaxID=33904 RepID=A0A919BB92_9ACTN|nr:hypothetical protein [Streptomyces mashuensis]GHF75497.1 hypothetical protein GCM10010218_65570 [Streptomyces mashuensis]
MTADKHAKRAARRLAEREGISYTAARRRLADQAGAQSRPVAAEPPQLVPIVRVLCPDGCDGSAHPGAVCRFWTPEDAKGVPYEVRESAELPTGRAYQVAVRYESQSSVAFPDRWLLALVYAMLADQEPEVRPDRAALRAAVESGDQGEVDAAMEPLDRAAARLLTKEPDHWWGVVKPRLDAYVDAVEADDHDRWPAWQEIDYRIRIGRLVDQWRRAWTKTRNWNGYYDAPGVLWLAPKGWLDALLVDRHGGHLGQVRLADGRPALVYAVEWGEAGPPVGYRVRELVPGEHGNVGRLVPKLGGDGERVAAADCRPLDEPA